MASTGASSPLGKLLRLASWIICLIVLASFVAFAVDETSSASTHQQELVNLRRTPNETSSVKRESTFHKTIDEAADFFTSPFSGVVSSSSSQWVIHGVKTVLALLIYGFVLSYLARAISVRV